MGRRFSRHETPGSGVTAGLKAPPRQAPDAPRGRGSARPLAAALTLAALALATAASAHHGETPTGESEPGTLGAQNTGGTLSTDTELTPVGKDGAAAGWQQIAGSLWRPDGSIADLATPSPGQSSPTPYDLDFYGVGFLKVDVAMTNGFSPEEAGIEAQTNGFAVGAQCRRSDPSQPVPAEDVEGCERVPVIYRYYEHPTKGLVWEESLPRDDATDPGGFAAAVAWLSPNRALAVGGMGEYPRREQELSQDQIDDCEDDARTAALNSAEQNPLSVVEVGSTTEGKDAVKLGPYERALEKCSGQARIENDLATGAGFARAWLYTQDPETKVGKWREITQELPEDPGCRDAGIPLDQRVQRIAEGELTCVLALQALDVSPRPADCGVQYTEECAIAGGMRQLWHFADGEFRNGYGPELNDGEGFFERAANYPRISVANFRFRVRDIRFAPLPRQGGNPLQTFARAVTAGCCAARRTSDRPALLALDKSGDWDAVLGGHHLTLSDLDNNDLADSALRILTSPLAGDNGSFNPDSYYALSVRRSTTNFDDILGATVVRTPGGPPERYFPREPPSRFAPVLDTRGSQLGTIRSNCDSEGCAIRRTLQPTTGPAPGTTLSSLRLVSADGGTFLEWAVGVLRSTGRGVAYHTAFKTNRQNANFYFAKADQCMDDEVLVPVSEEAGYCNPEAYQRHNASKALYALTSYALNAYRVAGEDPVADAQGTGWAVGDHGAIATRGGGVATAEAPPARRGARSTPEPVPGREAFDASRAQVTDDPGSVPALAPGARPTEPGFHEGQIPFASPSVGVRSDRADLIVMSRDGSEGWAFGFEGSAAIYRYNGRSWVPCDQQGIPGLVPPDPACKELSSLRVKAVARVPMERDSDPTNDEEFEAIALVCAPTQATTCPAKGVYRYRNGRWSHDDAAKLADETVVDGTDIAFAAPDDGWVVDLDMQTRNTLTNDHRTAVSVLHFDGQEWEDCTPTDSSHNPLDAPPSCGDPDKRLAIQVPCDRASVGLAVAGGRVYLHSTRDAGARGQGGPGVGKNRCFISSSNSSAVPEPYPLILYHDRDGNWRGGRDPDLSDGYNPTDGGWDPGCISGSGPPWHPTNNPSGCKATDDAAYKGWVESLSAAQDAGGTFQGWATGAFGTTETGPGNSARAGADALLMRLSDGSDVPEARNRGKFAWRQWLVPDAANEYLRARSTGGARHITLPGETERRNAFLSISGRIRTVINRTDGEGGRPPLLAYDRERGRWSAIPTPWSVSPADIALYPAVGDVEAIAPDGNGGFWTSVSPLSSFHHYTDRAPAEPFAETPDPTGGEARITALGAGQDGTVWIGDASGALHRYDRLAGWVRGVRVSGWDPARATRRAAVNAVAVGPDGSGVAVGDGGRIATLGTEVRLDPAATIGCDPQSIVPPCGTGQELLTAAVAPDGSAIVAGKNRTVLWRPAGGDFRTVEGPPVPRATDIAKIEMPSPDRAYALSADGSRIIRGEMSAPGTWSWHFEVGNSEGTLDSLTRCRSASGRLIRDLAVDASGRGYAVGTCGMVLERTGEGEWRRLPRADQNDLRSVALPEGGGPGALIGGAEGRILTLLGDRFEVARHADPYEPLVGEVFELAITPGHEGGQVEAWAVREGRGPSFHNPRRTQSLLHYPAEPGDPRLAPTRGQGALADTPASVGGELAFAAFGKQECASPRTCGPPDGSTVVTADLIARGVHEEVAARSEEPGGLRFALFTGDAVDRPGGEPAFDLAAVLRTPLDPNLKHRRWVELVADPLVERDVAMLGAVGGQDLAEEAEACVTGGTGTHVRNTTGDNCPRRRLSEARDLLGLRSGGTLPWRRTMASAPAPWEEEQEADGLRFERIGTGVGSQRGPDVDTPDLPPNAIARVASYDLDEGDTHYAVDVVDEATDEKVARIVVVDTSMRSIAASDPQQHPIEAGGQLRWLDEVLCFEGSAEDTDGDVRDCTREPGQQAIVLSNTPTYSYGPISPEETQTDGAAFEAILLKNQVNVVVSGRLGWNGRYWTLAPGVHAPCPGQGYRPDSNPPSLTDAEVCGAEVAGGAQGFAPDPNQAVQELPEDAKQAAGLAGRGAIPFVVSSTAGGRFNERALRGGFAAAESGFWRGYSIVRLSPDGDPAKTIVEQRPILDWVGLSAHDPSVAPGQRLQLQSFAREAFGMDTAPRYYEIPETQVITHRWHLLLADPDEPWRTCEAADSECEAYYSKLAEGPRSFDSAAASGSGSAQDDKCSPYLCLPERVGTIDPDTGEVRAGNGKYPDTFAIATLSVGRHVAAQPLVFTKSPSFIVNPAGSLAEVPPPPTETGSASAPPPPPGTPVPNVSQPNVPNPPPVPSIAPPQTGEPPEPQPPAPPAPPPPSEAPAPISLTLAPPGITVATPTAVIQPPTPPVNPAPPGGARREARQRQAATQKSGADSDATSEAGDNRGDQAQGLPGTGGAAFTRHDHAFTRHVPAETRGAGARREPSFTTIARESPSASGQALLYTGGITLLALAAAMGWTWGRPTPRRRVPEAPAPARAWGEARRR